MSGIGGTNNGVISSRLGNYQFQRADQSISDESGEISLPNSPKREEFKPAEITDIILIITCGGIYPFGPVFSA